MPITTSTAFRVWSINARRKKLFGLADGIYLHAPAFKLVSRLLDLFRKCRWDQFIGSSFVLIYFRPR